MNQMAYSIARLDQARGFADVLGFRQVQWEEGRAVLELELRPYHLNLAGVIHGGVLMSLLDIVCAQAGLYHPDPSQIRRDRKSTRLNSSHVKISYAVFCL